MGIEAVSIQKLLDDPKTDFGHVNSRGVFESPSASISAIYDELSQIDANLDFAKIGADLENKKGKNSRETSSNSFIGDSLSQLGRDLKAYEILLDPSKAPKGSKLKSPPITMKEVLQDVQKLEEAVSKSSRFEGKDTPQWIQYLAAHTNNEDLKSIVALENKSNSDRMNAAMLQIQLEDAKNARQTAGANNTALNNLMSSYSLVYKDDIKKVLMNDIYNAKNAGDEASKQASVDKVVSGCVDLASVYFWNTDIDKNGVSHYGQPIHDYPKECKQVVGDGYNLKPNNVSEMKSLLCGLKADKAKINASAQMLFGVKSK